MPDAVSLLADELGRILTRSNRAVLYDEITDAVDGVTATTYPVLSGLARTGPVTVTVLAEAIGMDRTVVTKYVGHLVDAGLIAKAADADDGRSRRLELTTSGRATIDVMRSRLHRVLRRATDDWPAADVTRLAELLGRLTDSIATQR